MFPVVVSKGLVVRTIYRWGPNYKIRMDFKIVNYFGTEWVNIIHLTETDRRTEDYKYLKGGRIPGIWLLKESKGIRFHVTVTGLGIGQKAHNTYTVNVSN